MTLLDGIVRRGAKRLLLPEPLLPPTTGLLLLIAPLLLVRLTLCLHPPLCPPLIMLSQLRLRLIRPLPSWITRRLE